jgi:hypothetical protein
MITPTLKLNAVVEGGEEVASATLVAVSVEIAKTKAVVAVTTDSVVIAKSTVVGVTESAETVVADVVPVAQAVTFVGEQRHGPTVVPFAGQSKQFVSTSNCSRQTDGEAASTGAAPANQFLYKRTSVSSVSALRFGGKAVNEQLSTTSCCSEVGRAGIAPPRSALPLTYRPVNFVNLSSATSVPLNLLPKKFKTTSLLNWSICDGTVPVSAD